MVSFRRFVLAIAVLALFTGLASAQVLINGGAGSTAGNLVCTANVANPTQVRAEGHAELLGDIVIACTGGSFLAPGTMVPTANITVTLANTYVTSRVLTNSGLSEALLMIDEPGAPTGAGAGFGFTNCGSTLGAGLGGCSVYANSVAPPSGGGAVYAATNATTAGSGSVVNVFQGVVPSGSNQVIFNGIPILAPVTAGFARVFRITNIRASAAQLSGGGTFQGTTSILAGLTISNGLLLQSPVLTTANVFTGLSTSVRNRANDGSGTSITGSGSLLQCNSQSLSSSTGAAVLRFTEGFAAAFKTRVAPSGAYSGAATGANSIIPVSGFTQNVPGTVYGGSESGFILPVTGGTAGLADFGTRLKATFNNIPTGVTLYVSTTNLNQAGNTGYPANTNTSATNTLLSNLPLTATNQLIAGLVIGESTGAGAGGTQTGFLPLLGPTTNVNSTGALVTALTPDANGTATAVWEVLAANPAATDTFEFGVFYSYTGNQIAGTPQVSPATTVSMSFAPTVTTYNGSNAIPRFAPSTASSTLINVSLCQTVLLFPFVNTAPGFDTGISIANTTADVSPFSTKNQTGACTLNFFGSGAGTTTSAPFPSAGGNIAPGTLNAEQVSNIRNNFTGYVIAVCNFQLAHGYALFSDTGIRNWATGYLALVIPGPTSRSAAESLAH